MPFTPLAGQLGRKRAAHLLRRTCTGASIADIDTFSTMTAQEAMQVLIQDGLPNPPLPIDPATGIEWITNGPTGANEDSNLDGMLNTWMFGQSLAPGVEPSLKLSYSFRERIVFFMHTHFTTKRSKVRDTQALYYQNALFRFFAFDIEDTVVPESIDPITEEIIPEEIYPVNFRQLTKKISVDNAMLIFLDGRRNVAGNPNENYGRELLELYAIGRGLEGEEDTGTSQGDYIHYTEQDVQEAARVLSGFDIDESYTNIDEETGIPRGISRGGGSHDNGSKQFSNRLDNHVISPDPELMQGNGTIEESIIDEISQLVDLVYTKEETAKYIARKIYRFFVYHEISGTTAMIQDLADAFTANNFKLTPVLEILFTSQEFYEGSTGVADDAFGSIIKSPLDLTIGFLNNFDITVPDSVTDPAYFYEFMGNILSNVNLQGMDFYDPFEVAGYSAYHQYPIYNRSWITTNYLANRYKFVNDRITLGDGDAIGDINAVQFVKDNIPNAISSDARQLIVTLIEYFLPMSGDLSFDVSTTSELTKDRMDFFLEALLSGFDEAYWTTTWNSSTAEDLNTVDNMLTNLLNSMLQSPEYQLM